jgi:uncharacterized protein (TIGR00290 family)
MMNTLVSWSGGKDSCYAAMLAKKEGANLSVLLNVMNETGQRSRSHGLPASLLKKQASAAGIPIRLIQSSWQDYEQNFTNALKELKEGYLLQQAVFGDIDLQAHRDWEEMVCARADLNTVLPLWQQDRKQLLQDMLSAGIKTMIVSCQEKMGPEFLGRILTTDIIPELESMGVDPCGENGEFHTAVLDCPLFKNAIDLPFTGKDLHAGYWFLRWEND